MPTPKSDEWKSGRRKPPEHGTVTRKRAPRTEGAKAAETKAERDRRLLVEQIRKRLSPASRAAYDHIAHLRHEDLLGIAYSLILDPPTNPDGSVNGRLLSQRNKTLKLLSELVDLMRTERSDAPDSIQIIISYPEIQPPPDSPVFHDDMPAATDRAREIAQAKGENV